MHNKKRFNWKAALKLLLILAAVYVVVVSCVIFFGDIYELVFLDERRNAYDTSESNNTSTPFTSATPTILPTQTSSPTQPADPSQTIGPTPTADPTQTTVPTQTTNPAQTTGPKPTTDLQPTATPAPTSTPVPVFNPPVEDDCLPEKFAGFKYDIILNDKVVNSYVKEDSIFFPPPPLYSDISGVITFRGNNYRDSASYGTADIIEGKLEKIWFEKTGYIDIWTGVGWTGQPCIVQWDKPVREIMNIYPEKKSKENLVEVITAALDGKIYFNDLEDGKPTRDPIDALYAFKGGADVDPRGYPLLYVGHGLDTKEGEQVPCGMRILSLIDGSELMFIDGYDKHTLRWWPAFDAGALLDSSTDTLIQCGENGLVYFIKLNTSFSPEKGTISIDPEITKYRYWSPYGYKIGAEGSPVGYRNFIYFADNSGLLQCIDVNKMEPVWLRYVNDDTDSTLVLEEESENIAYLYTACEVDLQGPGGLCYIRKINAFTGKVEWEVSLECFHDTNTNGGAMATPVLGKNEISNLVIFNIAKPDGTVNNGSRLIALDKDTGETVWSVDFKHYSWSSPVAVYDRNGRAYLVYCDSIGSMKLIEGKTGRVLDSVSLELNIEASPAIFGNMVVVGTRGQKIWGVRIK